ncbi:hypothetical protein U9M48_035745, partial [Paspalum notatum var. saurae]
MPPPPPSSSMLQPRLEINPFHVLNSGSGSGGHNTAYPRPPHATTLRLSPVRATAAAGYGYPATAGAVPVNTTMASRTPSGELAPDMVQQLMFFAGWGARNRPPLFQNSGLHSPPAAASYPIRAAPPFISGAPGASGTGGGAVAVQSSASVARTYGPGAGGSRKPPNLTPLQITAAATAAADGDADGAVVEPLPPVLAMPSAAGAGAKKGKQVVAAAANGRVRKRAPPDKDGSKAAAAASNKPRQMRATRGKQRMDGHGGKDTPAAVVNQPGPPTESGANTDTQRNDLQIIVPVLPPPARKRKPPSAAAAPSSGRSCSLIARRSSAVAPAPEPAKKHTILTWLIDGGFASDGEKVFYVVPADDNGGAEKKVVSGAVTGTGVHCGCCDAVVPLPVFEAHAGGHRNHAAQQPWEKLLLVSGTSLLRRMQEAWEKERIEIFWSQEKEKSSSSLAMRKLVAKEKKGVIVERMMSSPRMKMMVAGVKDSSDDACGVCADGGELLCCDSCTSTFHPECLTMKLSAKLSEMVGVTNPTEDGFSWALLKLQKDKPASSQDMPAVLESNVKLAVALGVLNECFNPVKDRRTKMDMLRQVVYSHGSEFKRLSYEGFYTMVLEKDGEVISAALLRIHGTKVAGMPFAATLPAYRKQGMMRRLVNAVEQVLASVQVEKLVIPAVADLRSFSFTPIDPESRENLKRFSLVVITGTTLLQKPVAAAATAPQPPSSPRVQAAASSEEEEEEPWRKYTRGAPPLTAEELAFLEMEPPFCSFTDVITGNMSLQQALLLAGNSSSSVRSMSPAGSCRAGAQASCGGGGWRSCGESSAMALQFEPGYAHGSSSSN